MFLHCIFSSMKWILLSAIKGATCALFASPCSNMFELLISTAVQPGPAQGPDIPMPNWYRTYRLPVGVVVWIHHAFSKASKLGGWRLQYLMLFCIVIGVLLYINSILGSPGLVSPTKRQWRTTNGPTTQRPRRLSIRWLSLVIERDVAF